VQGNSIVREARKRSGLSQADLAMRVGTTQSAIARLEAGRSSPGFERVAELVAACGLELRISIREPRQRIAPTASEPSVAALRALLEREAMFVLTGEFAARLRSGLAIEEAPAITPEESRSNLIALCAALDDLAARVRMADGTGTLPFDRTPESLLSQEKWALATTEGDLDVAMRPPGTGGYRDLVREASPLRIGGLELPTASLHDVVRELEAANADPDLIHGLRQLG
jgi:transcriptional regulator with XRE-family HTH domain